MIEILPFGFWFDVVRVVENDALLLQRIDVSLVRMLVERQQDIRVVARAQHFAASNADLEDRRPTRDRRRNRHEGHALLFAAAGEPREKTANGLNAVLGV